MWFSVWTFLATGGAGGVFGALALSALLSSALRKVVMRPKRTARSDFFIKLPLASGRARLAEIIPRQTGREDWVFAFYLGTRHGTRIPGPKLLLQFSPPFDKTTKGSLLCSFAIAGIRLDCGFDRIDFLQNLGEISFCLENSALDHQTTIRNYRCCWKICEPRSGKVDPFP